MVRAIQTEELVKIYKSWGRAHVKALDNVNIEVEEGKIFALLGPNGAGKTTLIKILLKLIKPTSGSAYIFGNPINSSKQEVGIGYLPEFFQVPKYFTAFALLKYLGELSGLSGRLLTSRIEEVLSLVDLADVAYKKVSTFSKGMTQRLGIAQAILHNPEILFLDEPTEGLDPVGRKIVRELLIRLRNEGKTIFLNSHLLSEVELIADSIAILKKGRVIVQGQLIDMLPANQQFEIYLLAKPEIEGDWNISQSGDKWIITVQGSKQLQKILTILEAKNIQVYNVKPVQTTLEEVFFSYINLEE